MTRALRAPAGAYRAASASFSGARRRQDRSKPPCTMASDKEFARERAAHAALPDSCRAAAAEPARVQRPIDLGAARSRGPGPCAFCVGPRLRIAECGAPADPGRRLPSPSQSAPLAAPWNSAGYCRGFRRRYEARRLHERERCRRRQAIATRAVLNALLRASPRALMRRLH